MNELDVLKRFRDDVPDPSTDSWLRARAAIEAVRAETSEPPARPTPQRHGSPRNRRRLVVSGLGVAVAVTAIGVTLAVVSVSPSVRVTRSATNGRHTVRLGPAEVRTRLVDALSGAQDTIFFSHSSMAVPGQPTSDGEEWDYPWNGQPGQTVRQAGSDSVGGTVQNTWSLSFTVPAGNATNSGTAAIGVGASCNVSAHRLDVDFTSQTWQSSVQSCVRLTPGLDTVGFIDPATGQLISNIKTLVADRLLQVVGYPTIDGQSTIELTTHTLGVTTLHLWVNASTYLPVQSVTASPVGTPNLGKTSTTVDQYSYLSATPANLAHLQATIPPGFKELNSTEKG